ncbi:STAS domain-containing protein [Oricola cellulosilytica]|uniref:STAS domain-containing protein n=1 Tax=Oricola cellulosilytica TaxID=1429082 RepID=UPI0018EE71C4|nr:STAS domain-containing protein [Oricola cellulosilytica]
MSNAVGIYAVEDVLLVSIKDDITDSDVIELQDGLSEEVVRTGARGVVIDISALDIVDTFVGRIFAQLSGVAKLLDAETYIVGMRPAVAMTLVELGMTLPESNMALSVSQALRRIRANRTR